MFRAGAMRNDDKKTGLILSVCGIVPVIWLALMTAPYVGGGLVEIIRGLPVAMGNPFQITVCEDSVKTVLVFLLAYAMGIGIYFSTRRNYRRREEHGSAKWGDAGALNKKYRDKDLSANKLLTQNVRIGLDGKKHRRNLNILVCGGSGAGKTRFFCKPNAMQCNTSMVILDPKGEIVRDVGGLLEKKGYEVRVLDLINMHRSHCYNPFVYPVATVRYTGFALNVEAENFLKTLPENTTLKAKFQVINGVGPTDILAVVTPATEYAEGSSTNTLFPQSNVLQCLIDKDTDVKIGQNATVVITAGTKENILLLPLSVIAGRQGKGMVTVIKDGEQIQTEVTLGATDGAYIEILSGVEEGDVVSSVPPNLDPRSNS